MAGQRILVPSMGVRRPLKAEITSSNLVRATIFNCLTYLARSSSGLGHRPLKAEITSSNLVRATKHSQAIGNSGGLFCYSLPIFPECAAEAI